MFNVDLRHHRAVFLADPVFRRVGVGKYNENEMRFIALTCPTYILKYACVSMKPKSTTGLTFLEAKNREFDLRFCNLVVKFKRKINYYYIVLYCTYWTKNLTLVIYFSLQILNEYFVSKIKIIDLSGLDLYSIY